MYMIGLSMPSRSGRSRLVRSMVSARGSPAVATRITSRVTTTETDVTATIAGPLNSPRRIGCSISQYDRVARARVRATRRTSTMKRDGRTSAGGSHHSSFSVDT
jgi:hypothetical protein